jgi:hypothetical protein
VFEVYVVSSENMKRGLGMEFPECVGDMGRYLIEFEKMACIVMERLSRNIDGANMYLLGVGKK